MNIFEYEAYGRTTETVLANLTEEYFEAQVDALAEEEHVSKRLSSSAKKSVRSTMSISSRNKNQWLLHSLAKTTLGLLILPQATAQNIGYEYSTLFIRDLRKNFQPVSDPGSNKLYNITGLD